MAVSGINQHQNYYTPAYNSAARNRTERRAGQEDTKTSQAARTKTGQVPSMSKKAEEYLEKIKLKYGNMDFYVSDYADDEEARRIMSQGSKEYSVLINPETLEKMAADDKSQAGFEKTLDQAGAECDRIEKALEKAGETVKSVGMTFDDKGMAKYFASVESVKQKQTERLEKKADNAKEGKKEDSEPQLHVSGSSIEELLKNIKEAREAWEEAVEAGTNKKDAYTPFDVLL